MLIKVSMPDLLHPIYQFELCVVVSFLMLYLTLCIDEVSFEMKLL